MIEIQPLEASLGMENYSTTFLGLGGKLKDRYEDFVVQEITPDRTTLVIQDWREDEFNLEIAGDKLRHIHFTVQKLGLSTFDVVNILSAELRLPRNHIGYAGLKDKRALTVQMMSVPSRVREVLPILRLSRIDLSHLVYSRQQIQIGDLWGNHFRIIIRDVVADADQVEEFASILRKTPILNYFGVQRFGVARPQTHLIGKSLVKKNYEDAIRIMLTTSSAYEQEELREIRTKLAEELQPTDSMIDAFPQDLRYEKEVMRYLISHPGDFQRAFSKIPPRIQTLFVHSYQSYLFNRLLSSRVKNGLSITSPDTGDFVIQLDTTHSGRDAWRFITDRNLDEVRDQVDQGNWGLALIIPGYATKTPSSEQTRILHHLLESEGITLQDFYTKENKNLDSPGGLHLASLQVPDLETACIDDGIVAEFSLRKGSYATLVMRELMKNHPINRI